MKDLLTTDWSCDEAADLFDTIKYISNERPPHYKDLFWWPWEHSTWTSAARNPCTNIHHMRYLGYTPQPWTLPTVKSILSMQAQEKPKLQAHGRCMLRTGSSNTRSTHLSDGKRKQKLIHNSNSLSVFLCLEHVASILVYLLTLTQ